MQTLTKKIKAYLNEDGKPCFDQFDFSASKNAGSITNYDIVKQMAANGSNAAKNAILRLEKMTSRQKSESGIYWNLKNIHSHDWVKALSDLLGGIEPRKRVDLLFTAQVKAATKSRLKTFGWLSASPYHYPQKTAKVPYCNELMTVECKILS